jgi:hypothetical protein
MMSFTLQYCIFVLIDDSLKVMRLDELLLSAIDFCQSKNKNITNYQTVAVPTAQ